MCVPFCLFCRNPLRGERISWWSFSDTLHPILALGWRGRHVSSDSQWPHFTIKFQFPSDSLLVPGLQGTQKFFAPEMAFLRFYFLIFISRALLPSIEQITLKLEIILSSLAYLVRGCNGGKVTRVRAVKLELDFPQTVNIKVQLLFAKPAQLVVVGLQSLKHLQTHLKLPACYQKIPRALRTLQELLSLVWNIIKLCLVHGTL